MLQSAEPFLNTSFSYFETGEDFEARTLDDGRSAFRISSLAVRLAARPATGVFLRLAATDGPINPAEPASSATLFDKGHGFFLIGEAGYDGTEAEDEWGLGRFAIGAWGYTTKFDELRSLAEDEPERARGNFGFYALGEQPLYTEAGDDEQGLAVFARGGYAVPRFNVFGAYVAAGLAYAGLVPSRDRDHLGVGAATAFLGDDVKALARAFEEPVGSAETVVEIVYTIAVAPWLAITPDLQYVINPGADPAVATPS